MDRDNITHKVVDRYLSGKGHVPFIPTGQLWGTHKAVPTGGTWAEQEVVNTHTHTALSTEPEIVAGAYIQH